MSGLTNSSIVAIVAIVAIVTIVVNVVVVVVVFSPFLFLFNKTRAKL